MQKRTGKHHVHTLDELLRFADILGYGDVHIKTDQKLGLQAIVAIHSTKFGPAIGGCRQFPYPNVGEGVKDVLRLGQMMSYKAALTHLPHGGGKSVLIHSKPIEDRNAYFEAFGDFIDTLGGRYICAVDSGTTTADMDIIATRTPYVLCTTAAEEDAGDPGPSTAVGVLRGIQAAIQYKQNKDNLNGVHVAVQGVGDVGYPLVKMLHERGARISVADLNEVAVQRCVNECAAEKVSSADIYDLPCDVFAPCAMGSSLNSDTVPRLRCDIVAGSANNQLAHQRYATMMQARGILYLPDYVVNAGGLIFAAAQYNKTDMDTMHQQINDIYTISTELLQRAEQQGTSTLEIANQIARERLYPSSAS